MTLEEKKFYKIILDGKSATRGAYEWSLPSQNEQGEWIPGEWHSLEAPIDVPYNALHVTDKPKRWWKHGADCYEVETAGQESSYDEDMQKKGVEKCRLLRKLSREELAKDHNIVIVKDGETATVAAGQICFADGNSTVEADGNSTVRAYGNSSVRAYGNSTVEAYGNSSVRADGNSSVRADGNSTVRADGNSTVRAYGNSTVEADGNSTVRAYGNSSVRADGNSTVEAYGNSTVNQYKLPWTNNSKVTPNGNAVCIDRRSGLPVILRAVPE